MLGLFNRIFNKDVIENPKTVELPAGQIVTENNDGAYVYDNYYGVQGGYYAQMAAFNFDFTSQSQLIESYRDISLVPEVKTAIEEVVNEAISYHEDENPIMISLSAVDDNILPQKTCEKIEKIWEDKIISLLNLNYTAHNLFWEFYVDGIKAAHMIPNKVSSKGLERVVILDPIDITKIRQENRNEKTGELTGVFDFYKYVPKSGMSKRDKSRSSDSPNSLMVQSKNDNTVYMLPTESVAYVTSGMREPSTGLVKGWLHDAVKPANQLSTLENALIVYRLTRAPERRVFYIDVGGLTANRADQYVENLKNRFRNRMTMDPTSGTFKDKRHLMTMQEDFWLPRQNGRGTEVSTLAGGQSLGEIDDVNYFLKKLYKALNVPMSRFEDNGATLAFDRSPELSRDELKFSKYVSRVRKRFNLWLSDIIKTELLLTKTITEEEWNDIKNKIRFIYSQDFYLEEKKRNELFRQRLALATEVGVTDFLGTIYSKDFVMKNILKMTESEIEEQKRLISKEEPTGEIDELDIENKDTDDDEKSLDNK